MWTTGAEGGSNSSSKTYVHQVSLMSHRQQPFLRVLCMTSDSVLSHVLPMCTDLCDLCPVCCRHALSMTKSIGRRERHWEGSKCFDPEGSDAAADTGETDTRINSSCYNPVAVAHYSKHCIKGLHIQCISSLSRPRVVVHPLLLQTFNVFKWSIQTQGTCDGWRLQTGLYSIFNSTSLIFYFLGLAI